ncbi:MAG: SEC-C metal-binding domain-containing protein [Patescibacteria group bacterium]
MLQLSDLCQCGSGLVYGACCGAMEPCDCGSGEPAGSCCYGEGNGNGEEEE